MDGFDTSASGGFRRHEVFWSMTWDGFGLL